MEMNDFTRQVLDFQKSAFDQSYSAMMLLQEQSERTTGAIMEQALWMPEEGKKFMTEWINAYRKGCEDLKKAIDGQYSRFESFFETETVDKAEKPEKAEKAKAAK